MNSYSKDTAANLLRSSIKIKAKTNVANKGNNKHLINGRVHATECGAGFSTNIDVIRPDVTQSHVQRKCVTGRHVNGMLVEETKPDIPQPVRFRHPFRNYTERSQDRCYRAAYCSREGWRMGRFSSKYSNEEHS
ncbi:hypothetical protein BDFB_012844 [Asbolus verrucosus]|uniref:Uncharacterized protein n=1 Tax=Asbolus verrucosus TaxID=1661398 RepID=A0A482W6V0_ASBVE|nr:hypothetical protein BDFB_012844 [Asbolus verrucosus]